MQLLLNTEILFFILGASGGLAKSDLHIPEAFYNTHNVYYCGCLMLKKKS